MRNPSMSSSWPVKLFHTCCISTLFLMAMAGAVHVYLTSAESTMAVTPQRQEAPGRGLAQKPHASCEQFHIVDIRTGKNGAYTSALLARNQVLTVGNNLHTSKVNLYL